MFHPPGHLRGSSLNLPRFGCLLLELRGPSQSVIPVPSPPPFSWVHLEGTALWEWTSASKSTMPASQWSLPSPLPKTSGPRQTLLCELVWSCGAGGGGAEDPSSERSQQFPRLPTVLKITGLHLQLTLKSCRQMLQELSGSVWERRRFRPGLLTWPCLKGFGTLPTRPLGMRSEVRQR